VQINGFVQIEVIVSADISYILMVNLKNLVVKAIALALLFARLISAYNACRFKIDHKDSTEKPRFNLTDNIINQR